MKKCYLDSNILIYYKNQDSPFHSQTKTLITHLIINDFYPTISPLVIGEFIHQFRLLLINNKTKSSTVFINLTTALKQIFSLPHLEIINPPKSLQSQLKTIALMEKFSLRPRDAYHLLTMKHHQIKYFATFDQDFKKVFKQKILSPIDAQTLH